MLYTVAGYKEFENIYGMILEEQAKAVDAHNGEQAENIAKTMFDEGGYSSIYISYVHPSTSCYLNPVIGHEPAGDNWVRHYE